MRRAIWEHLTCNERQATELARSLNLTPVAARLLCLRGLHDGEAAARFLRPSLDQLHDPSRLIDLDRAVERILSALARRERIAVHGDYDVDGVTSTVMLRRALELLGGDVVHFIPERLRDGYGLHPHGIERIHAMGVALIVSVDCGIRGVAAAERARELGMDLIVTDHHEPGPVLPPALAVINPKRHDCGYPDKDLAGVGVALKLVQALCTRTGHARWLPGFVKIAAIGTLGDVVPLLGENRIIAKLGLERLSQGPHSVGLRALLDSTGLTGKQLDSSHVAFVIAPRVNAAGRMNTPDLATRLLLAHDESMSTEARALAEQLNQENQRRREEEADLVANARRAVEADPDVGAHNMIVVAGEGWHRGVIGIVASRLVDLFHRPAIVLSVEDGVAHGSCRSIPGFDMLAALEACGDLLVRFGGHRQAAGLTVDRDRLKDFAARARRYADDALEPGDLRHRLRIDGPLGLPAVSGALAEDLAMLAPFGPGNPRPVFHAQRVSVVGTPRRLKDRHLRMTLRQGGRSVQAVAWRAIEHAELFERHGASLDLAFSLDRNNYQGRTFLELTVADARAAGAIEPDPSSQ